MAAACGLALGLGHAPYDLPLLALLALPALFVLWAGARAWRRAAFLGWCAGAGQFALTLSWIVEPFMVDAVRHGWMAPFALIFMAGGLALFWALAFGAARALAPAGGVAGALALGGALTLAEWLRSVILTGFPWALPAYAWAETPVAQTAAWAGPHGLGLLILAAGFAAGTLRPVALTAAAATLALLWGAGAWRAAAPPPADTPHRVRLVQPNAPQHLKWRGDMVQVFYERALAATAAPADGAPPDLVIWPETAAPFLLDDRPDLQREIAASAAPGARVLLGIQARDAAGRWFNAAALLARDGTVTARYDKHHLVPFGEYLPGAALARAVGLDAVAGLAGSFSAGPGPRRLEVPGLPPAQPLICYEAIFPHQILTGARRPGWLLQLTNDAWFGTWSGPYQHLAQARFRAIEQGLPMVRAANTGVSAVIDARGRVRAALALGTAGHLDAALPAALAPTPYARTGDMPALALAALLVLIGTAGARRRDNRR